MLLRSVPLSNELHDFLLTALNVAKDIGAKHKETPRSGGYLCIADARTGMPLYLSILGVVPSGHAPKYLGFAQEKALRLAANPEDLASEQSRKPDEGKWGGAIRTDRYILSFSGLPEELDEAIMLSFAIKADFLTHEAAAHIARLTHNNRWQEFQDALLSLLAVR